MLKRSRFIFLMLLLMALVVACGGEDDSDDDAEATEAPDRPQVALVMKTLTNPFFIDMERGARRAEEDFGVELIVRTAAQETSIEQQIDIVEDLITEDVDAIVIAPGDSQALVPVLARAQAEGIIIVNIDNRLDPDTSAAEGLVDVPFISVDNEQGGFLSASYISEQVDAPTDAIILEGIVTAQNSIDRVTGASRAFEGNENITVVAQESADWKIDDAFALTAQLFEEFPTVGVIFAANDMMALGAIQYLEEAGRTDVLVAGYDALEEAGPALESGMLDSTIDQQAAEQGYLGVQYAVQLLNGEEVELLTFVDVILVTGETEPSDAD